MWQYCPSGQLQGVGSNLCQLLTKAGNYDIVLDLSVTALVRFRLSGGPQQFAAKFLQALLTFPVGDILGWSQLLSAATPCGRGPEAPQSCVLLCGDC